MRIALVGSDVCPRDTDAAADDDDDDDDADAADVDCGAFEGQRIQIKHMALALRLLSPQPMLRITGLLSSIPPANLEDEHSFFVSWNPTKYFFGYRAHHNALLKSRINVCRPGSLGLIRLAGGRQELPGCPAAETCHTQPLPTPPPPAPSTSRFELDSSSTLTQLFSAAPRQPYGAWCLAEQ